jgi:hypothetical protein
MMKPSQCGLVLLGTALLTLALGCGGSAPPPADSGEQAKTKVEALKRAADALAKDPNGLEVRAAMEEFRNQALDVEKHPNEAAEIVELYRTRIKGKYQSEAAVEVQAEVAPIEAALQGK